MKNTILQTAKYCFPGFNQFLICETKAQAKLFLKQNSSINHIKDLVVITDTMRAEILHSFENFFHTVYDITSGYALPLEDTRTDEEISNALWNDSNPENCDGCANQESIAASGETTKCREHQEKSDGEIDQWFIERASEFEFHPFVITCAMCSKREAFYVGVTARGTPFGFCRICRDDLVRRADAAKQLLERFGV